MDLEALQFACERVSDFALVHRARSQDDRYEALDVALNSLGLTSELREYVRRWASEFSPGAEGPILIGLILGLFAYSYETW